MWGVGVGFVGCMGLWGVRGGGVCFGVCCGVWCGVCCVVCCGGGLLFSLLSIYHTYHLFSYLSIENLTIKYNIFKHTTHTHHVLSYHYTLTCYLFPHWHLKLLHHILPVPKNKFERAL